MKRKLVKQGAATLMISLPSKWIKQHKLDKGDEVDVEETPSSLIIVPEKEGKIREATVHLISNVESFVRTIITNTYRAGYDKIQVTYENPDQFKILQSVVSNNLIGFEITKKEKNKCVVENITEPSSDQFDTILAKLFLNITSLIETTRDKIGDSDANKEEIEDISAIEHRIVKYDNFCRRTIVRKQSTGGRAEFVWAFLTLIVHAQRELYHLARTLEKKTKLSKETQELLREGKHIFDLLVNAYREKSVEHLVHIHDKEKILIYKKGYTAFEKSKGKESVALYHILSFIRQVYQANSPLIGLLT